MKTLSEEEKNKKIAEIESLINDRNEYTAKCNEISEKICSIEKELKNDTSLGVIEEAKSMIGSYIFMEQTFINNDKGYTIGLITDVNENINGTAVYLTLDAFKCELYSNGEHMSSAVFDIYLPLDILMQHSNTKFYNETNTFYTFNLTKDEYQKKLSEINDLVKYRIKRMLEKKTFN